MHYGMKISHWPLTNLNRTVATIALILSLLPVLMAHYAYTCSLALIMANMQTNSFIHDTGLNEENSLTHLLNSISSDEGMKRS